MPDKALLARSRESPGRIKIQQVGDIVTDRPIARDHFDRAVQLGHIVSGSPALIPGFGMKAMLTGN